VASPLAIHSPAGRLERLHRIRAGDDRQLRYQTATSTSLMATVTGIPLAARASTHAAIASRMLAIAWSSVRP
jgi:hypothetical protein